MNTNYEINAENIIYDKAVSVERINLKLIQRYSGKCETPEEIKSFNEFYDLEEARFKHEAQICNDYNIEEFMRTNF